MIVAIILSAGESSRMGRPKALLPIGGVRFIEKIVTELRSSRVSKILVVLGHNAEQMHKKINDLAVEVVINRNYKQGQLSSLIEAIRHVQSTGHWERIDGILVHLVDHPFVNAALVNLMIDRFYKTKKLIVVPRFHGRRGHPVIFARSLLEELLATPVSEGAKAVVHAHRADTLEIETDDEGVTIDIDTPEEYSKHARDT